MSKSIKNNENKDANSIVSKTETTLKDIFAFVLNIAQTISIILTRLISFKTSRSIECNTRLLNPLLLLFFCLIPYIILQWALVDIYYYRHNDNFIYTFIKSLTSFQKNGISLIGAILLSLPVLYIIKVSSHLLSKIFRVKLESKNSFKEAVIDGFAIQFFVATICTILCFSIYYIIEINQYILPTGLTGEPELISDYYSEYPMLIWLIFTPIIAGMMPVISIQKWLTRNKPIKNILFKSTRLISVVLFSLISSILSLFIIYFIQIGYKGTDIFERNNVQSTCQQIVYRPARNVLKIDTCKHQNGMIKVKSIRTTLVYSNGSNRYLLLPNELGIGIIKGYSEKPDVELIIESLYLKLGEVKIAPSKSAVAVPIIMYPKSNILFNDLKEITKTLNNLIITTKYSFVGETEEFRYHGELNSSQCESSFRSISWVVEIDSNLYEN